MLKSVLHCSIDTAVLPCTTTGRLHATLSPVQWYSGQSSATDTKATKTRLGCS